MKPKAPKRTRGRPKHADVLTPSEWRTVHAVQHGMTNAEIARRGGTLLMLSAEGGAKTESLLHLRVDDIVVAHVQLIARGVKFTHAPHMIHRHADGTEEWMAFFEDPDARPLAIMMQAHKRAAGAS